MRKNILILVSSIVLFSLFNTIETNFNLWNNPTINTNHIITPDVPVSFDTDISLFGLFVNFFSDLELDYTINNTVISNESVVADNNLRGTQKEEIVEEVVEEEVVEEEAATEEEAAEEEEAAQAAAQAAAELEVQKDQALTKSKVQLEQMKSQMKELLAL